MRVLWDRFELNVFETVDTVSHLDIAWLGLFQTGHWMVLFSVEFSDFYDGLGRLLRLLLRS